MGNGSIYFPPQNIKQKEGTNQMENKNLSLKELNELYLNNPNEYKKIYGETPKTFKQLTLKEQTDLYNQSKEMYEYYLNNPNEPITQQTNNINVETSKTINDMKELQKEITQMKESIYNDYPSELEWEKRLDELVNESLKNILGGN